MTKGELIQKLSFRYIENWEFNDHPCAVFYHPQIHEQHFYLADLRRLVADAQKLGLENNDLVEGLSELEEAQSIFDRIVEPANIYSFYS